MLCVIFLLFLSNRSVFAAGWVLDWSDEFDYTGLPDSAKWGYETGFRPQWSDISYYGYKTWYSDARWENSRVENGNLVIEARADGFGGGNSGYNISTATVSSRQTKQFLNGKIEIRAKMPTMVNATDNALWFVGSGSSSWPEEGEIDLLEYTPAAAWGGVSGLDHGSSAFHTLTAGNETQSFAYVPTISTDYHIYSIEWDQTKIDLFYDGNKVNTYTNNGSNHWPFNHPIFLYMNIEPGDWAAGGGDLQYLDISKFPVTYYVDYVRYYTWGSTPPPDTSSPTTPVKTSTSATTQTLGTTNNITIRARGVAGDETIDLRVNGVTKGTWTLSTTYQNYAAYAPVSSADSITVNFTNDTGNRDVQIDYAIINGTTYQAENQTINTGAWNSSTGACGGIQSEWLHCNGYIQFKITSVSDTTPPIISSCTPRSLVSSSVSPSSVTTGGSYTISCDYGATTNAINAVVRSGSCTFQNFLGTAARFACTAGNTSGTFTNTCTLSNISPNYYCARTDTIASLTVTPAADTSAPTVPTNLTATAVSSSQINLNWTVSTDNVGVVGYKVYRGGVQIATSITNSYSNKGLAASTAYSYTVSAYDAAGNNSAQSASKSATTQAGTTVDVSPPSITATTNPNQQQATLVVSLFASPNSGAAPLTNVFLTASTAGTAVGNINYTFYCNQTDSGTNIIVPYSAQYGNQISTLRTTSAICQYQNSGSYTAKVIVERGGLTAEARTDITVLAPMPTATQSILTPAVPFVISNESNKLLPTATVSIPSASAAPGDQLIKRTLKLGFIGDDVKLAQNILKVGGTYKGAITGNFDTATETAVKTFQCSKKIVCSGTSASTGYGVLGPKTKLEVNKSLLIQQQINLLLEIIKQLQAQLAQLLKK